MKLMEETEVEKLREGQVGWADQQLPQSPWSLTCVITPAHHFSHTNTLSALILRKLANTKQQQDASIANLSASSRPRQSWGEGRKGTMRRW